MQTGRPDHPDALYLSCLEFLTREADLLDRGDLRSWLALLTDDVTYRIPVRTTRERAAGPGISEESWHMYDDRASLESRVSRLETEYAWAEDPPSRTRHFVTNVRVQEAGDVVRVLSNLLLFRSRDAAGESQFLSGERQDLLHWSGDGWRLRARTVLLDHATLPTHNIAVFL